MTKRTRAATAAASPADALPDRRTLLASAGAAAALIASTAPGASAALASAAVPPSDADDKLMALRPAWEQARQALGVALDAKCEAETRAFGRRPQLPDFKSWPDSWTSYTAEHARILAQRRAIEAEEGCTEAEERSNEAMEAETEIVERIAALPARSMAGLAFKLDVSADWSHDREDIRASVIADIHAFAAAHPSLAL